MKYETKADFRLTNGSCLRGVINATFQEIVDAFGLPLPGDGEKVKAEWIVCFEMDDETVIATIYDWKQDCAPEQNSIWNIGGFDSRCVDLVEGAIAYNIDMRYEEQERMHSWEDFDAYDFDQASGQRQLF